MFAGNAARDWSDAKEKQHMSLCVHLGRCLVCHGQQCACVRGPPEQCRADRGGPWRCVNSSPRPLEARPAGRGTPMMAHETCCGLVSWVWTLPDQVAGQAKAFYSSIQGLLHCKGMYGSIQFTMAILSTDLGIHGYSTHRARVWRIGCVHGFHGADIR
jgi:hypothetical protein